MRGERDDRELLRASRAGGGGFDLFYRRHCQAVLAFHAQRVGQPELAADLTAETFAAALVAVHDRTVPAPSGSGRRRTPPLVMTSGFTVQWLDRHGRVIGPPKVR